jgi:hypothetical protein
MKNNKKADINFFIVSVIIIILSFFIYLSFFSSISNIVVSETDNLACTSYVATSDNSAVKAATFFYNIDKKCSKDDITEKLETKDEKFQLIGDRMVSCWERYGKGQYDFMSNINTEGNWCFTCGAIEFTDSDEVYDYNEFIKWTNNTKLKRNNEEITYHDYVAMKYSDYDTKTLKDISDAAKELEEIKKEGDPNFNKLMFYFSEQNQNLQDLAFKEINTNEKIFLVYRYDRWEQDLDEVIASTAAGAAGATALSFVVTSVATGGIGFVVKLGTVVKALGEGSILVSKISKIMNLMSKTVKISTLVGAAGAGGVTGFNYNSNNLQYVDIMTQEQYYRLCGTEPRSFN